MVTPKQADTSTSDTDYTGHNDEPFVLQMGNLPHPKHTIYIVPPSVCVSRFSQPFLFLFLPNVLLSTLNWTSNIVGDHHHIGGVTEVN